MVAEPELITIEEAAQYLRVCEKTLYRWLRDGKMRAYRLGRRWRFRRVDLDEWLLAQRNPPGEAEGSEAGPDGRAEGAVRMRTGKAGGG